MIWANAAACGGSESIGYRRREELNIDMLTDDAAIATDKTFKWCALKQHDGLRGSRPIPAYRLEPSNRAPKRWGK